MSIKYKLNPKYIEFNDFLIHIKDYFKLHQNTIHKARNELKIIHQHDIETVVKAFKIPNLVNQFAYAHIRGSKAKKSFNNALKLQELHINTPSPIGYIEFFENNLLKESFFITEYQKYDFLIREPLFDPTFKDRENILKAFTEFTYLLHKNNVYHSDYSAGNILVYKENKKYIFSIVDINRMRFMPIDVNLGLKNFSKLWANEQDLSLIGCHYAQLTNSNKEEAVKIILEHDRKLKNFVELKRKLRGKK